MIKANEGRILISVDMDGKDSHRFDSGLEIKLVRRVNQFNRRISEPVNGIVVEGDAIPAGTQILVHHNALSDTNAVNNYVPLSGSQIASNIKYFAIPIEMAFAWLDGTEWKPCTGFAFGLRVFRPYIGILQGIAPTQIKDVLYVTTGELKGRVVQTLKASDYQIIFQDTNGQEGNIIRFRHYEGKDHDLEQVLVCRDDLTDAVNSNELYIGITISDAKPLNHKTETSWQISQ